MKILRTYIVAVAFNGAMKMIAVVSDFSSPIVASEVESSRNN